MPIKIRHSKQQPQQLPLLDQLALQQLVARGLSVAASRDSSQQEAFLRRSGDHPSPFRGSGIDYDESRPYQPGDDLRNINWRLQARSGDLYTKIYMEERESSYYILIDRRAGMRFGTRNHLKVTRALQIAAFISGCALARGYSIAGILLQPKSLWLEPRQGMHKLQELLTSAAAPCPPLSVDSSTPGLYGMLSQLQMRVTRGSHIVLISDFHDINTTDIAILTELGRFHQLQAIQVLDPVEQQLPQRGAWSLNDFGSDQHVRVQAGDQQLHDQYQQQIQQQQQLLEKILTSAKVPLIRSTTDQPFADIEGQLSHV